MGCRGGSRAQELVFEPWPVDRDDEPPRRGLTGVSDRNSPRRALAVRPFLGRCGLIGRWLGGDFRCRYG
jgi:hypothetical protein